MFQSWIEKHKKYVNSILIQHFPQMPDELQTLYESMQYSLLNGGKRLRPLLCIASLEALGIEPEKVEVYLVSLELLHCYSLIHDDLPCMDNDDLRRGMKTNHIVFGENIAVLAGDALLTEAFRIISLPNEHVMPQRQLEAINLIANYAGWNGMIGGQVVDVQEEKSEHHQSDLLMFIHENKTGKLIKTAVLLPAILAGIENELKDQFNQIGTILGLMFQIQDDILDVVGDQKLLGKQVMKDHTMNKLTYPSVYGIEKSKKILEEKSQELQMIIGSLPINGDIFFHFAELFVSRTN